jgi:hypothetical protein
MILVAPKGCTAMEEELDWIEMANGGKGE